MKNKRLLLFIPLVLALVLTAYAAGTKITLDSSYDMRQQIDNSIAWYDSLEFIEKAQWDLAFSNLALGNDTVTETDGVITLSNNTPSDTRAVYTLPGSTVFHTRALCRHISGKTNINTITRDEALGMNLSLCKTCKK